MTDEAMAVAIRQAVADELPQAVASTLGDAALDAFGVREFCRRHCISRPTFYSLLKEGRGPRTFKAGRRTLISIEAARDWRRDMEAQT